jgi:hypothetical protein
LKNSFTLRTIFAIAVSASGLQISTGMAAPTQAQQAAIRSSCQSDYRTYCSSVPTGGSEALQCLEKNVASLSASCQQAVRAASGGSSAATTTDTTAAPSTETAPATASEPAANEPAAAAAPASPPAPVAMQPKQEIALMRQACGRDYRTYCAGVRIIGGGAVSCLLSHAASLSQACKNELGRLGQRF